MAKYTHISKKLTLASGLFAAVVVVCTSLFQFSLGPVSQAGANESIVLASGVNLPANQDGPEQKKSKEHAPYNVCTIQAVSHGVQLHVTYDPFSLELFEIELPEFKLEVPRKVYSAGWEYFKVLFSDIISPNAP